MAATEALVAAEEHLARGLELYGQEHYTEAVEEFRAGYTINADQRLLYALAQALRLAGRCPEAAVYYQEFLDRAPGEAQEAAARANLERCRAEIQSSVDQSAAETAPPSSRPPERANHRPTQAGTLPPPKTPRGSSPPPSSAPTPSPWLADPLGATLTGVGLVGAGTGVALLFLASSEQSDAERLDQGTTPGTYQQQVDRLDRGRAERLAGGISLAVGFSALILGALRYHSVASRQSADASLMILPAPAGAVVRGVF